MGRKISEKLRKTVAVIIVAVLIVSMIPPQGTVYAATDKATLEAQIKTAKAELEKAQADQKANDDKIKRGSLGFMEYMLAKPDISAKQKYDLERAKEVMEAAMDEDFSHWYGGDSVSLPAYRNGKVTAIGDRNDAISLDNMDTMFSYLTMVNEIRESDDIFVGSVKRNPAKTNFYFMAVAQTGADRAAGLKRHSSLQVSCENLAFGQNPYIWTSEKSDFKKAMQKLGMTKLTSEEDIRKVIKEAENNNWEVGHYTNLFWAVDQVMGIGFTNYNGTNCYNASNMSNYNGQYALYTITYMEKLYREYYSTVNPVKFQQLVDKKQKALNDLYEQYYAICPGHTYKKSTVKATCDSEGYTANTCTKCGYVQKSNITAALGHDYVDGVCSRCGKKTVIKITGINWRLNNYTNATYNQKWEEGSSIDFSISYTTASDYKWGDEFVVDVSDTSVLKYTPENNHSGTMEMLKPGVCTVKVYAKDNPATLITINVDVTDVGGHKYVITPSKNGATDTTAKCSGCGRVIDVKVPTISRVAYSNDNISFGYGETCIFSADSLGYVRIYLSGYTSYSGLNNNELVFQSADESIIKYKSGTGYSNFTGTFDTGRHGVTTLTVYPKYNPGSKKVCRVIVKGSGDKDVTGITLDKTSVDLYLSGTKTAKINATVVPSDAFIKQVEWTSSNPSIAKVDTNGNVTGLAKGYTYIYAKATDGSGKSSNSCRIYVWGKQEAPKVTAKDFTVSEQKITSNLSGNYEYRIKKNGTWSSWSSYTYWTGLSTNTSYDIGVRLRKNSYEYLDSGAETVVTIKTNDHTPETIKGKAATCTASGLTDGTRCAFCGTVIKKQETIPAKGHSWDSGKVTKAATCTAKGVKTYTCTKCKVTKTEDIPAKGHKAVTDAAVAATCTKAGKTAGSHCSVCGTVITVQQTVKATGHSWDSGKVTKAATCTAKGVKTYTCTKCKVTKTEDIPAKGHKAVTDEAVAATCTKAGKTAGSHCSVCGTVITAQQTVKATGHSWDSGKVTKAATCTAKGVKTYTCTKCKVTKTEDIPAKGHKEVTDAAVAATCIKAGKTAGSHCSVCGTVITAQQTVKAKGHSWDSGKITTQPTTTSTGVKTYTCTNCKTTKTETIPKLKQEKKAGVSYTTHIQSIGWQPLVRNGDLAGTVGDSKRLEAIKINLEDAPYSGNIEYRTHVQTYGWQGWVKNGALSGTSGQAKRLEAIQIRLTGEIAKHYDVYYRIQVQSFGWLGWAKNGEYSGSAGYAKRLEAIQIVLVEKGKSIDRAALNKQGKITSSTKITDDTPYVAKAPSVHYQTHIQSVGWQDFKKNGEMSGTSGQAKRLEGIRINLSKPPYDGGIRYKTHIQSIGWQDWKYDGDMSGTSGQAKRLEAISIELTGEMAEHYDVYYRVHAQSYGWLGWAKNGQNAGTAGYAKRLEGIQIVLVEKGKPAPGKTYNGITANRNESYISK